MINYQNLILDMQSNIKNGKVNRKYWSSNSKLMELAISIRNLKTEDNIEAVSNLTNEELQQLANFTNLNLYKYENKAKKEIEGQINLDSSSIHNNIHNSVDNNNINDLQQEIQRLNLENQKYKELFNFKQYAQHIELNNKELQQSYEQFVLTHYASNIFKLNNKIVIIKDGYIIENKEGES